MVIGDGLEHLAKHHMSYPSYMEPDEWTEQLQYIANCFKQYKEEPENIYFDAYDKSRTIKREAGCVTITEEDEALRKAYFDEEKRLAEEQMKRLKEGFDLLYEVFPNLWD